MSLQVGDLELAVARTLGEGCGKLFGVDGAVAVRVQCLHGVLGNEKLKNKKVITKSICA